jgi:hypothetical protein
MVFAPHRSTRIPSVPDWISVPSLARECRPESRRTPPAERESVTDDGRLESLADILPRVLAVRGLLVGTE